MSKIKNFLIMGFIVAVVASGVALAQTPAQDPASGLQVSPTRTELSSKAGSAGLVNLSLKNVTGGKINVKTEVLDFEADNDTGAPKLLTDNSEPTASSIRNFISPINDFQLGSNETKKLKVPLNIPKDQPAGAYYGVIRFKAFPIKTVRDNAAQQEVALTASVGHIVLLEIPGAINTKLIAESIKAEKNDKSATIFSGAPDKIGLGLKNVGNGFIKPFGRVVITNYKGDGVYSYEINSQEPKGNILPSSSRTFHDELKNVGSGPGKYTATASVAYGNGGDVLVIKSTFWIIPWWLRAIIILVLLAIITAIFRTYRKLRQHRRGFRRY